MTKTLTLTAKALNFTGLNLNQTTKTLTELNPKTLNLTKINPKPGERLRGVTKTLNLTAIESASSIRHLSATSQVNEP